MGYVSHDAYEANFAKLDDVIGVKCFKTKWDLKLQADQ